MKKRPEKNNGNGKSRMHVPHVQKAATVPDLFGNQVADAEQQVAVACSGPVSDHNPSKNGPEQASKSDQWSFFDLTLDELLRQPIPDSEAPDQVFFSYLNALWRRDRESVRCQKLLRYRSGQALHQRRMRGDEVVKHGKWQNWIQANCEFGYRTAVRRIKFALAVTPEELENDESFSRICERYGIRDDDYRQPKAKTKNTENKGGHGSNTDGDAGGENNGSDPPPVPPPLSISQFKKKVDHVADKTRELLTLLPRIFNAYNDPLSTLGTLEKSETAVRETIQNLEDLATQIVDFSKEVHALTAPGGSSDIVQIEKQKVTKKAGSKKP